MCCLARTLLLLLGLLFIEIYAQKATTVLVVGGGLAGLSAALEAQRAGAHVIVVEKEPRLGGNSAKASSGMNAVSSHAQRAVHSTDSVEAFMEDTLKSGGDLSDDQLVRVLVQESADAVSFLMDLGVNLDVLSQCGGHSHARTHRAPPRPDGKPSNIGWDIMSTLIRRVHETEGITVTTSTTVLGLLTDGDRVVGIQCQHGEDVFDLYGASVILATGGYAADRGENGLLSTYSPDLAHLATTNGPFAVGEGIKLAQAVGAGVVDMDQVQIHPTGFVDPTNPTALTKFLAPEALRACGGLLFNGKCQRFVNELGKRDEVSRNIFNSGETMRTAETRFAYMVLNEEGRECFQIPAFDFYRKKNFIETVNGVEELAALIGCDVALLKESLQQYRTAAEGSQPDAFGKTLFPCVFRDEETFYVMQITPSIHYCMGGVRFNEHSQVLQGTHSDTVIPGLFAAGEVTGGLHGMNRLAGNSLLECVVFGRRAGIAAAASRPSSERGSFLPGLTGLTGLTGLAGLAGTVGVVWMLGWGVLRYRATVATAREQKRR